MAPLSEQNVFSDRQNLLCDKSAFFGCDGRLFHSPGPAAANAVTEVAVCPHHDAC